MENENNKIHIQSNSCSLRNVLCMIHVVLVFDKQNFVLTSFCHAVLCMIPVVLVVNKQNFVLSSFCHALFGIFK